MDLDVMIIFDQKEQGLIANGVYGGIIQRILGVLAKYVIFYGDRQNYKEIPGVKIPAKLKNLIHVNATVDDIQQALDGLLDDHPCYSNLRVIAIKL
jgi:hypothetical protein